MNNGRKKSKHSGLNTNIAHKKQPIFSAVNAFSQVIKIAHFKAPWFGSIQYFSTKSPSTSTAQRGTSTCMPCRYRALSCSRSHVYHYAKYIDTSLKFRTVDWNFDSSKRVEIWESQIRDVGWSNTIKPNLFAGFTGHQICVLPCIVLLKRFLLDYYKT